MRRLIFLLIILIVLYLVSFFVSGYSQSSEHTTFRNTKIEGLSVYFFYGEGCPHCTKVKPFIDEMERSYGLNIERFEVYGNRANMKLIQEYFERYNVPVNNRGVPAVFVSDSYLVGDVDILNGLENLVSNSVTADSETAQLSNEGNSEECTSNGYDCLSFLTITAAALVDSVNPCSIAILFFLMAGLLLLRNRKRALRVGLAFALSVFLANLLFGLGIFSTLSVSGFSSIFDTVAGFVAILTGILLVKDCFFHGKVIAMEVPRSLQPYLKHRLSEAFFGKSSRVLGAFLIGFLVTLFEIPCTGGPYFFVLARMADDATRMQTIPILLYYNLIFVMPLILISTLLYFGSIQVERVREWKDRNKQFLNLVRGLPLIAVGFVTISTSLVIQWMSVALSVYRAAFIPLIGPVASYIVYQIFSKSKYRVKALKYLTVVGIGSTLFLAAISNAQTSFLGNPGETGSETKSYQVTGEATTATTIQPYTDCEAEGGRCMMGSMGCSIACKRMNYAMGVCELGLPSLGYYPGCGERDCCCFCVGEKENCTDVDKDGYAIEGGNCGLIDCNDADASVHPGAVEICNGIDDDCDEQVDEGDICVGCVKVKVVNETDDPVQADVILDCLTAIGSTNYAGSAVSCNHGKIPGFYYVDAFIGFPCYGESYINIDEYGTGYAEIGSSDCVWYDENCMGGSSLTTTITTTSSTTTTVSSDGGSLNTTTSTTSSTTTTISCQCTEWKNTFECCNIDRKWRSKGNLFERTCNPRGCDIEKRCKTSKIL